MEGHKPILDLLQAKASQRILFSQHALRRMSRPDRMISTTEIRMAFLAIITAYLPDDEEWKNNFSVRKKR